MIWAKVVEEEIQQTHPEDPAGLWHPDALQHWEEVPDYVNVGWKRKNGEWISGGQWYEEFRAENPLPDPGPPTAAYIYTKTDDIAKGTTTLVFRANCGGHGFDEESEYHEFVIDGKTYTDEEVTLTFEHGDTERIIDVEMHAYGPGGKHSINATESVDHETVTIPAKFVPLFMQSYIDQLVKK